jgi:hypothetical protein
LVTSQFIVSLVGLAVFGGAAGLLMSIWLKSLLSRRWPTTPGQVIALELTLPLHNRLQGRASVLYQYIVDGQSYTGSRVRFGDWLVYSSFVAREIAGRYPQGRHVTVRYNPRNPQDATLESAVATVLMMWLGIMLFGFTTIVWALWRV